MSPTVLIVDDHAAFRSSARLLLESEGFHVVGEADDGASAVAKTAELGPDVVLLDVHLPDIDGFEVADRVTHTSSSPIVILISSRDAADFGPLVEGCGALGFVAKADLSGERVRSLLEG